MPKQKEESRFKTTTTTTKNVMSANWRDEENHKPQVVQTDVEIVLQIILNRSTVHLLHHILPPAGSWSGSAPHPNYMEYFQHV